MGSVGPWELIIILALAILLFGPSRLSGLGKAAGKMIREFREAQHSEYPNDSTQDAGRAENLSDHDRGDRQQGDQLKAN